LGGNTDIGAKFTEVIFDSDVKTVDMVRKDSGRYIVYLNKVLAKPMLLELKDMELKTLEVKDGE